MGTWEDFTGKWGFHDGNSVEQRDFEARAIIISKLNGLQEFKASNVRAVAYDRPGVHNPCLIVLLPNPDGKTDEQLLADWLANKIAEAPMPAGYYDVDGIVFDAYMDCDVVSHVKRSKPKIQLLGKKRRSR